MTRKLTPEALRRLGIVGAGGAGFPAEVKCRAAAETVIVNAAECEPLLHKDKELLRSRPEAMLEGLHTVMRLTGAKNGIIGIKEKYADVIALLKPLIPGNVAIHPLGDFYPAGDEFVLVYLVTGKVIPPGGLPIHVGCVVNNVETLMNIGRAVPVTRKFLTVAGAVARPVTIGVPVGISFAECVALAGGATVPDPVALTGGALMGKFCDDFTSPVIKTTGGLIILPRDHPLIRRYTRAPRHVRRIGRSACDQCSYCTELCPRYLLGHPIRPHIAMRALGFATPEPAMVSGTLYCCECNLCTLWSCPEDLDPRAACVDGKAIIRASGFKPQPAGAKPHPLINERRTPVRRLMRRLGLDVYVNKGPLLESPADPSRVVLPLLQHAGVPAVPCVNAGDSVREGDMIAEPPEGALGAAIHASISGRVIIREDAIVIEKH
ncbi:MAG TPA: 4Fe-4S dicluster domain-containing protein [Candidatus Sumerlaeota bacterium]|nr:4Fe-4S dicluster domain-containing protein [Candidatus Sumerlaeota bacterium]